VSSRKLNAAFKAPIDRSSCKFVLVSLADRANSAGVCYSSNRDIRSRTGLSRRQVQRALRVLEADGFIRVLRKGSGGPQKPPYHRNVAPTYWVLPPSVPLSPYGYPPARIPRRRRGFRTYSPAAGTSPVNHAGATT
jgi:hypothetical protein